MTKRNIMTENLREEIAKELGVYEQVKKDGGWENIPSKTCGNMVTKAIEIAKNEWAISVDSYDYRAELQSDGTYVVRVIGKTDRNEVTRYIVNVKTGVATEVQ